MDIPSLSSNITLKSSNLPTGLSTLEKKEEKKGVMLFLQEPRNNLLPLMDLIPENI